MGILNFFSNTNPTAMEMVLIRRDEKFIAEDKAHLGGTVPVLQSLYNSFKAIGLDMGLPELIGLLSKAHLEETKVAPSMLETHERRLRRPGLDPNPNGQSGPEFQPAFCNYLEELVKDKLMQASEGVNFGGLVLRGDKLRELLQLPDLTEIKSILIAYKAEHSREPERLRRRGLDASDFILEAGVAVLEKDAYAKIEARHSHYTRTEKGVRLYGVLTRLCEALNAYREEVGETYMSQFHVYPGPTVLQGLERIDNGYSPSLSFIRMYEGYKGA